MASGSKQIKAKDVEVLELPIVRRKKSREQIFQQYTDMKEKRIIISTVGIRLSMRIIGLPTSGNSC